MAIKQLGPSPSGTTDAATKGYVDTAITAAVTTGLPYDVSYVQCLGARATGLGDNTLGMVLQRAAKFTSVTFRCATADASGTLTVELRKNGSTVTGTSTSINTTTTLTGTSTGSWSFFAGDLLTVYITANGTTPGNALTADITGVTA